MTTFRVDYDDDALTIIENVNLFLEAYGLEFVNDGLEHDGWEEYTLVEIED